MSFLAVNVLINSISTPPPLLDMTQNGQHLHTRHLRSEKLQIFSNIPTQK